MGQYISDPIHLNFPSHITPQSSHTSRTISYSTYFKMKTTPPTPSTPPTQAKIEYQCPCGFTVTLYTPTSITRHWKKGQQITIQHINTSYEWESPGFLQNEIRYAIDTTYNVTLEATKDFHIIHLTCPICKHVMIIKPATPSFTLYTGPSEGWKLIKKSEVNRARYITP